MNQEENDALEAQIGSMGSEDMGAAGMGKININRTKELSKEEKERMDAFIERTNERNSDGRINIYEGWIPVDRVEMGERSQFYPEDWQFYIKPATVEAIKNWSSIDEENIAVTNRVFNEIMKLCVSISTNSGRLPWNKINSWDRFWFILKVREYTFVKGEAALNYDEECPYCGQTLYYDLKSNNLAYDLPDESVIQMHYSEDERCWVINPKEYDLDRPTQKLYIPTLEKDDAILNWAMRENEKGRNLNETFLRFLPWMLQKAPKNEEVLDKFIKECKRTFDSWDTELFSFMDEVLKNIQVVPEEKLKTVCENCGEEVKSAVRFQNGVKSIFAVQNKHRKFGTK